MKSHTLTGYTMSHKCLMSAVNNGTLVYEIDLTSAKQGLNSGSSGSSTQKSLVNWTAGNCSPAVEGELTPTDPCKVVVTERYPRELSNSTYLHIKSGTDIGPTGIQRVIADRNIAFLRRDFYRSGMRVCHPALYAGCEPSLLTRAEVEARVVQRVSDDAAANAQQLKLKNARLYARVTRASESISVLNREDLEVRYGSVDTAQCNTGSVLCRPIVFTSLSKSVCNSSGRSNSPKHGNFVSSCDKQHFHVKGKPTRVNIGGIFHPVPLYKLKEIEAKWQKESKISRRDKIRGARSDKTALHHDLTSEEISFQMGNENDMTVDQMKKMTDLLLAEMNRRGVRPEPGSTSPQEKPKPGFFGTRFGVPVGLDSDTAGLVSRFIDVFEQNAGKGIQQVSDTTSSLERTIKDVTNKMEDSVTSIQGVISGAMGSLIKLLWVVPLVGAAWYVFNNPTVFNTVMLTGVVTLVLAHVLPSDLWSDIQQYFTDDVKPQMAGIPLGSLPHILTICSTYMLLGRRDNFGLASGFIKALPKYNASCHGWEGFTSFITTFVEDFVNYIRGLLSMDPIKIFKSGIDDVDAWCNEVFLFANSMKKGNDVVSTQDQEYLGALYNKGCTLIELHRMVPQLLSLLEKHTKILYTILESCGYYESRLKGSRPEPPVLCLMGVPGVGKSFLSNAMVTAIIAKCIHPTEVRKARGDLTSKIYSKGLDKFWNGYTGQYATVIDDFGQGVADDPADNNYLDVIMMANCWPFPLKFADVESKGKSFFSSKLIVLTTNLEDLKGASKVLTAPEAFSRRITHGYEITLNDDYAMIAPNGARVMNYKKVKAYTVEHKRLPDAAWNFTPKALMYGKTVAKVNEVLTINQIITRVVEDIKQRGESFTDFKQVLCDYILSNLDDDVVPQGFVSDVKDIFYDAQVSFQETVSSSYDYVRNALFEFRAAKGLICDIAKMIGGYCSANAQWVILGTILVAIPVAGLLALLKEAFKALRAWFVPKSKETKANPAHITRVFKMVAPEHREACNLAVLKVIGKFRKLRGPKDYFGEGTGEWDTLEVDDGDSMFWTKNNPFQLPDSRFKTRSPFDHKPLWTTTCVEKGITHVTNKPQMCIYSCGIVDKCINNMSILKLESTQGYMQCGQIIGIVDRIVMMPKHYISFFVERMADEKITDKGIITIRQTKQMTNETSFTLEEFLILKRVVIAGCDCVLVEFPRGSFRTDIRKAFFFEKDIAAFKDIPVRLDTVEGDTRPFLRRSRHMDALYQEDVPVAGVTRYVIKRSFKYVSHTRNGDCGGLLSLENGNAYGASRILGMHVAGSEALGIGYSNIITQEMLAEAMKELQPREIVSDTCFQTSNMVYTEFPIKGSFSPLGCTGVASIRAARSQLVKLPMRNCLIDCDKRPAFLAPFINKHTLERIDPMLVALAPYSTPVRFYDEKCVQRASYMVFQKLVGLTKKSSRQIYDYKSSVSGSPRDGITSIPRGTSPGYPYNTQGFGNKSHFWGAEGDFDFSTRASLELEELTISIVEDAKKGIRCEHVFTDFLKDEARSEEKVMAGKSRLISAAPLPYTVVFRQYFLAFTNAVQKTRIHNGCAVGIDPNQEWSELKRCLTSKGDKMIAGDFKGFDSSEQPQILWSLLDRINEWYDDGEENRTIRRVLWMEVVHSRHLGGPEFVSDIFYQWNKSLPSGHPATSIINSFYNLTIFGMVWIDCVPMDSSELFWDYVHICTYGDDNILNVSDKYIDCFNQHTVSVGMAKLGMIYTDENKGSDTAKFRSLSEVSFLKRSFRDDLHGFVACPKELNSILSSLDWCSNGKMKNIILKNNVEVFLMELAMHGDQVWDQYIDKFLFVYKDRCGSRPASLPERWNYLEKAMAYKSPWGKDRS